jgi:aminoacrylate hydrolase
MKYELHGRTDAAAETVLLSAGLGGAGAYWKPQLAALAEEFRVVLYDQRGTGANAGPLPDDYSIGAMADDVVEVMDAAGVARAHVVGHALGGLLALELALRHPDRVGRLVVVNGWMKADSHTRRCFAMRIALLHGAGAEAYVKAQPIFLYPAAWLSKNAERVAEEEAHGIAHFQGAENILKRIGALLAYDASARAGAIQAPVLVAASRDDVLVPYTASEALAAALPNATLWMVPEGGHGFTVTEPEPFNTVLCDFLSGRAAT